MNVAGNLAFSHPFNHLIGLLAGSAKQTSNVQVTATSEVLTIVIQYSNRKIFQSIIIHTYDMLTMFQHTLIAFQLCKTNTRHDVGHIALIPRAYHIVFPGSKLRLSQSILVLTMQ